MIWPPLWRAERGRPTAGLLEERMGWQVVATVLPKLPGDPDPQKSKRVMEAILQMNKLDIAGLEAAHHKKSSGARRQLRPAGA